MTTAVSGRKYYKGRLYQDGKTFPYVVWDGVRSYENHPPIELFAAELCGPEIAIMQIGKKPRNIREVLTTLIETADSVVLWARDHTTYRAIVDEMKAQADVRMQ
jgi:hypothetical protein